MAAVATPSGARRRRLPWRLRRARRWLFYACARSLVAAVRAVPRDGAVSGMRALAALAFRLRQQEVRAGVEQWEQAFGGDDSGSGRRHLRRSLDLLAVNLVDMIRADVPVDVSERARRRLERASSGGPVLVLMAHLGAWELVGPVLARATDGFGALTADPHNEWVDRWLRRERRVRGIRTFDRDRELGAALRWLREGRLLAVLADHRTRGTQVPAPWFGREVPTSPGPGRLAHAGGATILPVGIRRRDRGHELLVGEAFEPTGRPEEDTRRCNAALQGLIAQSPEEWTWIHDRTRP